MSVEKVLKLEKELGDRAELGSKDQERDWIPSRPDLKESEWLALCYNGIPG